MISFLKVFQNLPLFEFELPKECRRPHVLRESIPHSFNVFERILSMQLCDYFQDKLSPYLSAYRKHYSCQTALLRLLEELRTAFDSNEHAPMVDIDLSKAFDCLLHELLLSKLKAYGLSGNSVKFLASYLINK